MLAVLPKRGAGGGRARSESCRAAPAAGSLMAHSPHLAMRRSGTQAPQASSLDILKPRPAKAIWFCEMRIADAHAPKPSGAAPAADSFPLGRQLNGMMLLETHLARLRKGDRAAPALSGTPGASGIDVPAGPVAATTAVAVIGLTAVATVKKRRSRPGSRSQSLRTEVLLVRWSL